MIKFLLKGIIRDRSRSLLPIIIISIGVMLTVMLSGYMSGAFGDMIDQNAKFETGHVKVMTSAYAENIDQLPNDLALLDIADLIGTLQKDFPDMEWVPRIKFGGLIDIPNENGETKSQGPAIGMALDLLSQNSTEPERMNISNSLVSGALPRQLNEAIIGHEFAEKLGVSVGDDFTYFGTTMESSMTFQKFRVAGTVRFGTTAMDNRILIVDVADAQMMLDMEDGAGEILGFSKMGVYHHHKAEQLADSFNDKYKNDKDEFAPIMLTLKEQNNLGSMIDYANSMTSIFVFIFIIAMSIVLWNTGLLGGLRRYKEFGIRLALGESKSRIYTTLILEAIIVGIIGSILGTAIGLAITYYLQVVGIDVSEQINNSAMIMPTVLRSKITPQLFFIGFIPGVLAMVLGTMLSGIGIYKRETANLFKELEV